VTQGAHDQSKILFVVETPLGFSVRTTTSHWKIITGTLADNFSKIAYNPLKSRVLG